MRYCIPVFANRIAPRSTIAEGVLIVTHGWQGITSQDYVPLRNNNWTELKHLLAKHRVDTLVCGGISRENRLWLENRNISIVENVACTVEVILAAIGNYSLRSGLGFETSAADNPADGLPAGESGPAEANLAPEIDCLSCCNRVCQQGKLCPPARPVYSATTTSGSTEIAAMLEAATDINCEVERTLCRLSELIYFCLEMDFRNLGLAYCQDLEEPAQILRRVLQRFFNLVPVSCKVGGIRSGERDDPGYARQIACNPVGQACLLNRAGCDLNISVGLCVGADCVFNRQSAAPVTTLFVKDKSLANNPIGALYSEYYLREAAGAAVAGN